MLQRSESIFDEWFFEGDEDKLIDTDLIKVKLDERSSLPFILSSAFKMICRYSGKQVSNGSNWLLL